MNHHFAGMANFRRGFNSGSVEPFLMKVSIHLLSTPYSTKSGTQQMHLLQQK